MSQNATSDKNQVFHFFSGGGKNQSGTNASPGDKVSSQKQSLVTQWLVDWANLTLADASLEDANFIKKVFPTFYTNNLNPEVHLRTSVHCSGGGNVRYLPALCVHGSIFSTQRTVSTS
jgi:hypothetical protein